MKEIWEILARQIISLTSPFVLVLDDYPVIEAAPIHECIALVVEQTPPLMHLVIATRADPPLPLSRLRLAVGCSVHAGSARESLWH